MRIKIKTTWSDGSTFCSSVIIVNFLCGSSDTVTTSGSFTNNITLPQGTTDGFVLPSYGSSNNYCPITTREASSSNT